MRYPSPSLTLERRCLSGMAALALGAPRLKQLWAQGCLVGLQGVRMLAQRPDMIVEVVKESSTDQNMITDWQLLAYSSAAGPRQDLPDNVDYVDDAYCSLYSEERLGEEISGLETQGSAELPDDPNYQESCYDRGMEDSSLRNYPDSKKNSSS